TTPITADTIIFAGEPLTRTTIEHTRNHIPNTHIINGYGPTETNFAVGFTVPEDISEMDAAVPIGRPVANMRVYVLDSALRPVPVAVTGELYIAGAQLARG
ncbi:AMP-binding protein, partial [Nocardia beijingensis]|uniref:AMP-binding protein n=1 Tax=Nocardia beijingensis TaxID=95162 RepID=UPI0018939E19